VLAAQILAVSDEALAEKLAGARAEMEEQVMRKDAALQAEE
jgi:phosphoribosylcarboxyaminoimidazole (NCAIR) mutase